MVTKELKNRILTSMVGLAVLVSCDYWNISQYVVALVGITLYSEILIVGYNSSIALWKKILVFVLSMLYLNLGIAGLSVVVAVQGFLQLLLVVFLIDTAGYVFGKLLGGKKLMPSVSPNKTWSGFLVAILVGALGFDFVFSNYILINASWFTSLCMGVIFAVFVQLGDLLVSYAKRIYGVKDFSGLLPGHGGFWDRCDSVLAAGIIVLLFLVISDLSGVFHV